MYEIDKLTLISGIDIPIPELSINIHQPTIREIAFIGEVNFFEALSFLLFDKDNQDISKNVTFEDKVELSRLSNFQIIMTMIKEKPSIGVSLRSILTIIFPNHNVQIEERFILLNSSKGNVFLNEENFSVLQDVIRVFLCLPSGTSYEDFNPQGEVARKIAEKIQRGRAKIAQLKGEQDKKTSYLARLVSSLGIGTNSLNITNVLDLTIYQLFNQVERYGLYTQYHYLIQAKMQGAKDVEDIDWLKDIEK